MTMVEPPLHQPQPQPQPQRQRQRQSTYLSFLLAIATIGGFFISQGRNAGLNHEHSSVIHPQLEAFRQSGTAQKRTPIIAPTKKPVTLASFFQTLCQFKIPKCCKQEERIRVLDTLSMTLGKIQSYTSQRPVSFDPTVPSYRDIPLNCTHYPYQFSAPTLPRLRINGKDSYEDIFSGNTLRKGRTLVDLVMVSYELDVLEARLYELHHLVEYFCIFESGYNHRGWKKARFVQTAMEQTDRFKPFQDKIVYIDIDTCPEYMVRVNTERGNTTIRSAGKDMWDIQNSLRLCRWKLVQAALPPLPDDAMVIVTDLDWFPQTNLLKHFKHCEPSAEYGFAKPFHMTMSHILIQSIRMGSRTQYNDVPFAIHSILRINEVGGLPNGRGVPDHQLDVRNNKTIPFFCGGIHLQDMGTLANVVYRDVTHAESASMREDLLLAGRSYCNVTDEYLSGKQLELSVYPELVHWKFSGNRDTITKIGQRQLAAPTEDQLESLRNSHVPWIFIEHWEAFPFAWGYGNYSMIGTTIEA
jgi:hypothetical protein